jgi:hypothetical protein
MKGVSVATLGLLFACCANNAFACSIAERSAFRELVHGIFENKWVKQAPDCSFVNGGEYDHLSGEAAIDLGNGRIGQKISGSQFLVVVCNAKQAVVLKGVRVETVESSCGPYDILELDAYLPPGKKFDFHAGDDFSGFLKYANGFGMQYSENLDESLGMGRSRDHVNLLCGCEIFYPQLLN